MEYDDNHKKNDDEEFKIYFMNNDENIFKYEIKIKSLEG